MTSQIGRVTVLARAWRLKRSLAERSASSLASLGPIQISEPLAPLVQQGPMTSTARAPVCTLG